MRHSMAWPWRRTSSWVKRQAVALRDADLLAHQVDAADHLGHRMLDLEPGVHLDEVEFAVLVEELDRAGAAIAHVGHRLGDDAAHLRALLGRDDRRGRFLDAPSGGGAGSSSRARRGGSPCPRRRRTPGTRCGAGRRDISPCRRSASPNAALASDEAWLIRLSSSSSARDDLHAAPAAARRGLDQHRIADLGGDLLGLGDAVERAGRAGDQRQAELRGGALGLDLVAHDPDMLGLGPDPDQVVALDDLGELGVFADRKP